MARRDCRRELIPTPSYLPVLLGLAVLTAGVLQAQNNSPVTPAQFERWNGGVLQPGPILEDKTAHPYPNGEPDNVSFPFDVDIEGNYAFVAAGRGLGIHDVSAPNNPQYLAFGYGEDRQPFWGGGDTDWFYKGVDAPLDVHDIVAIAGEGQGVVIWDTTVKAFPIVHYQDGGPGGAEEGNGVFARDVYATTLNGRHYAFVTDESNNATNRGLRLYDMTAAATYVGCYENAYDGISCPDVFKGFIGPAGGLGARWVHGTDNYVAVRRAIEHLEIWDVADPLNPQLRISSTFPDFTSEIAMWRVGATYYLAGIGPDVLWIYNVSCITSGACSLPAPIHTHPVPADDGTGLQDFLSFSWSGSTPFLYVGNESEGPCLAQREYLLDVSTPTNPQDVTPQVHPEGYWGWYYSECNTGFKNSAPLRGKFNGAYFYRTAFSYLDSHQLMVVDTSIFADGFESGDTTLWSITVETAE